MATITRTELENLIGELRSAKPLAVYYTPRDIGQVLGISPRTVWHHCRRLFPGHEGHYRFFMDRTRRERWLNLGDLELLLRKATQSRSSFSSPIRS